MMRGAAYIALFTALSLSGPSVSTGPESTPRLQTTALSPTQKGASLGSPPAATGPTGQNAIRFNAAADRIQSTAPANTPLTAVWFGRLEADRNDWTTFVAWSNGAGGWWVIETFDTGTDLAFCDFGAGGCTLPTSGSAVLTVGTWYCIAAVLTTSDSPDTAFFLGTVSGTPTKFSNAVGHNATAMTPTTFSIGTSVDFPAELLNGDVAGMKIWNAALSDAEVTAECAQLSPVRSTNLWAYYPLDSTTTMYTDASGNGRDLTNPSGTGTFTQVAGPFP